MFRRLVLVCALVVTVLSIPGSSSAALNWCAEVIAPHPQYINASVLGGDTEEWKRFRFDDPDFDPTEENEDPRGVYGSYGMAGQFWHSIRSKDCFDDTRLSFKHEMANLTWSGTRGINTWTLRIFGWATSDQLNEIFTPLVTEVLISLRDSLWRPLLPLVVTVGAIWMAWVGLVRKRATLSAQGALWMVAAIVLGFWILFSPNSSIKAATSVVDTGSGLVNAAVNQVSSTGTATDCPGGSTHHITQWGDESWSAFQSRETREMLWTALQCRPWQAGVFGSDQAGQEVADQYGYTVLRTQSVANGATQERIDSKKENFELLAETIEEEHPEVWPMFRGSKPEERLSIGFAALTGSLLGGGPIAIIGLALMVFKMAMLVGFLFSPIFLLLGVAPGPGRRLLGQYGVVMGGILVAQIALLLILLVTALSYGLIWSQDLDLAEQIIAMLVLFLGMLAFWAPLWKIVRGAVGASRPDTSLGAPAPLAAAARRSAESWRWKSAAWVRRKTSSRPPAAAGRKVVPVSTLGEQVEQGEGHVSPAVAGRQAPDLVQDQDSMRKKLARGQGAPRPTTGPSEGTTQTKPREDGSARGYRGSERLPQDAPTAAQRPEEPPRGQEQSRQQAQQQAEVLRKVRTAETNGTQLSRREPGQAPPVQPVRPSPRPTGPARTTPPGPVEVPPTQAPAPSRPPVRQERP